jgi:hypothetical protein
MLTNRISAYLSAAEDEQLAENVMPHSEPNVHNPILPPACFAPVPQGLLDGLSKEQRAWQQELYRSAYQVALAAQASEALRRAQRN